MDDDPHSDEEIIEILKMKKVAVVGMSKNPEWVVDVPTDAEIRVMMAEEKAIQEAALASLNVEELSNELKDSESALMNLRFKTVAMQLSDVNEINRTKRKISRIKTIIRERELSKVSE